MRSAANSGQLYHSKMMPNCVFHPDDVNQELTNTNYSGRLRVYPESASMDKSRAGASGKPNPSVPYDSKLTDFRGPTSPNSKAFTYSSSWEPPVRGHPAPADHGILPMNLPKEEESRFQRLAPSDTHLFYPPATEESTSPSSHHTNPTTDSIQVRDCLIAFHNNAEKNQIVYTSPTSDTTETRAILANQYIARTDLNDAVDCERPANAVALRSILKARDKQSEKQFFF